MKHYTIKAFGFQTEAPRWALTLFALVLIAGASYAVYRTVYLDPEKIVITLKDANRQLAAEVEEYGLHAMEEPQKHELFEEEDGKLLLRVFKDHCVLIQRQTRRGVRSKLVVDLDRAAAIAEGPAWTILPVVYAESFDGSQPACQRGCINPHPGQFRWWYGEQRGDWVEVWRQWAEGCTHSQLFNPRARIWDSNQDGSARVRWTCCVH